MLAGVGDKDIRREVISTEDIFPVHCLRLFPLLKVR